MGGATPVVASWQLAMCGVIAAATLALLGATGAVAFGTKVSPVTLTISLVGMAALFLALRYVARIPAASNASGTEFWRCTIVPAKTRPGAVCTVGPKFSSNWTRLNSVGPTLRLPSDGRQFTELPTSSVSVSLVGQ